MGLSNVLPENATMVTFFCIPMSFGCEYHLSVPVPLCASLWPRLWAAFLNEPVTKAMKHCLREKAERQGKSMVKVTVSKKSNKTQVTNT